jgi:integrase
MPEANAPGRQDTPIATMQDLFDLVEHNYRLNNRSSRANGVALRRLRRHFARYAVAACTSLAISHYMDARQRAGRKPETINREMNVLRRAFRLGYQHDVVSRLPLIQRLPELGVRNEFFTREEMNLLLPHLPDYLRDAVLFGFLTGWRKGEIVGLQWNNVDRSGGAIRLEPAQNKGREVRVLVLQGELAALVERRWQGRRVGQVLAFHVFHRDGCQIGNFRSV